MFSDGALRLLAGLEANNNRDWFPAHRDAMRACAQEPFADLLESVSNALADAPLPLMGSAATMFQMNRDVRFSNGSRPTRPMSDTFDAVLAGPAAASRSPSREDLPSAMRHRCCVSAQRHDPLRRCSGRNEAAWSPAKFPLTELRE
jgi:hypothetical protein